MNLLPLLSAQRPSGQTYVEDVFSAYPYVGTGATQTITNGIDLAGKGGMVWIKDRANSSYSHVLQDTVRGGSNILQTTSTAASVAVSTSVTSFGSTGFTLGTYSDTNNNTGTKVAWTFRKAAKFFDVVTYTGTGSATTFAHSLGSVPGMIIVKRTDSVSNWEVYHSGLTTGYHIQLNNNSAQAADATVWNSTAPTSSVFSVGTSTATNALGGTYVAYIFGHDTSATGMIQCGTYTGTGSTVNVNLGVEPQLVFVKNRDTVGADWRIFDTSRGFSIPTWSNPYLPVNTSSGETASSTHISLTHTGFSAGSSMTNSGSVYVWMAIRRGPMKTPTSGTQVFAPISVANSGGATNTTGFPIDMQMTAYRSGSGNNAIVTDRVRGISTTSTAGGLYLQTENAAIEASSGGVTQFWTPTSFQTASTFAGWGMIYWNFSRCPGVLDIVSYTGNGTAGRAITHALGVVPEMIWVKSRFVDGVNEKGFAVRSTGMVNNETCFMSSSAAKSSAADAWGGGSIGTSSTFNVGLDISTNTTGGTYVAYLFATVAGVSKVGTYTGNGTSQTINCGFAAGARFVMIKQIDTTGDWLVWDSARGIIAAADPVMTLNTSGQEVTTDDGIDPTNSGFIVNQTATTNVNMNIGVGPGTYIYLAIA